MSAGLRAAALHDAWDFVCPRRGVLFCAWRELYEQYGGDGDYVWRGPGGEVQRAMHHELPECMPEILRDATGVEDVEMVGTEGAELQGEVFEAWVQKCLEAGTDEYGWRMADHIVDIAMKP